MPLGQSTFDIRPMRVSTYFQLDRSQPTLDFVDVDVEGDSPVFVDPRALRLFHSAWADECVALIQSFFQAVLRSIKQGQVDQGRGLLRVLHEPNETHLGLSRGRARGHALGPRLSADVWHALSRSEAAQSGLLEDLEDTILMVEGIASDLISDITTNVIREPLIHYTQDMARQYDIPLTPGIDSGPLWDPLQHRWYSELVPLPRTTWGKLLLVPKAIVRRRMEYDVGEYYRLYLLEHLMDVELKANSELVHLLKDGRPRVTKKDLTAKYGVGKATIVRETLRHPQVLARYRADKRARTRPPLDHDELALTEGGGRTDWLSLLSAVETIAPGPAGSTQYERAVEALLTALLYPSLAYPKIQLRIHEGRKRIDITYSSIASLGFFSWLSQHYAASHIFVECKNYSGEVGNPELDQLSGRFSPSRGQVGLLVCRHFDDKQLFLQRCRDTADDHRGFIMALDDEDLRRLVAERQDPLGPIEYRLLRERFERLVF